MGGHASSRSKRSIEAGAAIAGILLAALLPVAPAAVRGTAPVAASRLTDQEFWKLASGFSEPDGTFHSENLVSNEADFQSLLPQLEATAVSGRAYVGVGSEQNFSYIATVRPSLAFIVDVRRGNFDLHLLYKALFELSADRADFVSRLFSRKRPAGLAPSALRDGDLCGVREGRPESGAVRTQSRGRLGSPDDETRLCAVAGRQTRSRVRIRRVVQAGPRHPLRAYERRFWRARRTRWVSDLRRPDDVDRWRGPQSELPRFRGVVRVREGSRVTEHGRTGGRKLRRNKSAARGGLVPQAAGDDRLGVLRLERRTVPPPGRPLGAVLRECQRVSCRRVERLHSIHARRLWRPAWLWRRLRPLARPDRS